MSAESEAFILFHDPQTRAELADLCQSVRLPVRAFDTSAALLEAVQPTDGGCLLADTALPGISGLELLGELRRRGVRMPMIFLTRYGDVETAVRAMKAGAFDFVEIPFRQQELLERIGRAMYQDKVDRRRVEIINTVHDCYGRLTPREREIMKLVVAGRQNKRISETLNIRLRTVELHRRQVMEKMRADSLADLVRMAVIVENADGECVHPAHHPHY